MNHLKLISLLSLCLLALGGCQPSTTSNSSTDDATQATPQRVESADLDLALREVPEGFQVLDEDELRLRRTDDQAGEMWVEVGEEATSINLVQEVRDWEKRYDEMPEGAFKGQLELGTQFGTAYHVRGRYLEDDLQVEQVRIFSLHPVGYRLLSLVYTYPAGEDTSMRRDHALAAFEQLEALDAGAQNAGGSETGSLGDASASEAGSELD